MAHPLEQYGAIIKAAKSDPEVAYMGPKSGPFDCGHCRYFDAKTKACQKVAGEIQPRACCNWFRPRK